ncbi:hypothetical protein [Endozoicomonas lisbonensis]|uniref:Uncharacterized protein n=1 Tax=Endozoicomonas lisbonensis TaxID=3120522 RepID=A0ABV2SID7_9GAMM
MSSNDSSSVGGSPYSIDGLLTPPPSPPPSPGVKNGDEVTTVPAKSSFPPPPPSALQPPRKPIADRALSTVTPAINVNTPQRAIQNFTSQTQEVRELKAQVNFVSSIPMLLQQLEKPEQAFVNTPFFILVNDGGKQVRLIPPDPELVRNKEKYQALKAKLAEQLNAINQHYQGSEGTALGEKALRAEARLEACRNELDQAGIPEPAIPYTPILFAFSSLLNATPSTQPASAVTDSSTIEDGEFVLLPDPPARPAPPRPPTGQPATRVLPDDVDPAELSQHRLRKRSKAEPPNPVSPGEVAEEIRPTGQGLQKVQTTFLQPSPSTGFANIYHTPSEPHAKGKIASVNSGNPNLAVGHGGINREFSDQIHKAASYQKVHERMVEKADAAGGGFITFGPNHFPDNNSALVGAAIYRPEDATDNTGTIFIDVFNKPPGGDQANGAMIYAIAPNGTDGSYPDTEDGKRQWLLDMKTFSGNILAVQNTWNLHAEKKYLPVLPVLRSPMVGGGFFKHPKADKNELAAAIQAGFDEALAHIEKVAISEIQYEETADQHFRNVQRVKGKKD